MDADIPEDIAARTDQLSRFASPVLQREVAGQHHGARRCRANPASAHDELVIALDGRLRRLELCRRFDRRNRYLRRI